MKSFFKTLLAIAVAFVCIGSEAAIVTNVFLGTTANDHTGDPARTAFQKLNNNDNLLQARITTNDAAIATLQTNVALATNSSRVTSLNGKSNAVVLAAANSVTNADSQIVLETNSQTFTVKFYRGTNEIGSATNINKIYRNDATTLVLSGQDLELYSTDGKRRMNWDTERLYRGGDEILSLDWGEQKAYAAVSDEALDWRNRNLTGAWTLNGTNLNDLLPSATAFVSTNIPVPTAYTVLTNTHTLGSLPSSYRAVLVNLTAEQGYSIGDEVALETVGNDGGNPPVCISWNATNFYLAMSGTSVSSWNIRKRGTSGGQNFNLTHDFWAIKIYARQ
jgi:hypothetical protein